MAIVKSEKAAAALEKVRNAGRIAKREAKQRAGGIGGVVAAGVIGWAEGAGKAVSLGPVHVSLLALPAAFATSMFGNSAMTRMVEAAAAPVLGVAAYKLGKGETVLGDEYGTTAGEYGRTAGQYD